MSFQPITPGFGQSLLGIASNDLLIGRQPSRDVYSKRLTGPKNSNIILNVIITAIIFVSIVSVYDILRSSINNYYAKRALIDPRA